MNIFKKALLYLVVVIIIACLSFGGWWFSRSVNYSLSYKSMVEQTVRDMVKKEALK